MRLLLGIAAVIFAGFVPAALADSRVVPDDGTLPWTDPNHQHPLEVLAGQVASQIVGHPVPLNCEGETDWNNLPAPDSGGFVSVLSYHFDGTQWSPVWEAGGLIRLSPQACTYLVEFARASVKPTKCSVTSTEQRTTYKTVRYQAKVRVRVKKRVRVNGHWVVRYVWVTRTVWKTKRVPVTTTVTVQGPPEPCYASGRRVAPMTGDYWQRYAGYAWALQTVAHEAAHLSGDWGVLVPDGYPNPGWAGYQDYEARAECHGMQRLAFVAQQFGATPEDARGIAEFYFTEYYPHERGVVFRGQTYWSPECHAGGTMDTTPTDGVWP